MQSSENVRFCLRYNFGMKKIILTLVLICGFAFSMPETVVAQGLVPCSGDGCSFCHLVELGNNVVTWILGFAFVLFGVLAFVAGFGLVTSGGNEEALRSAKTKLTNAFIGLIIIMSAWLIVDTIMKTLIPATGDRAAGEIMNGSGANGFGPWNRIDCSAGKQAEGTDPVSAPAVTDTGNSSDGGGDAGAGGSSEVPSPTAWSNTSETTRVCVKKNKRNTCPDSDAVSIPVQARTVYENVCTTSGPRSAPVKTCEAKPKIEKRVCRSASGPGQCTEWSN